MGGANRKEFALAVISITFVMIALCVVMPFLLYARNPTEFSVGIFNMLSQSIAALLLAPFLIIPFFLVRGRAREILLALALVLNVGIYLQSQILLWDYGLLDGTEIPWNKFRMPFAVDLGVWFALIFSALFFSGRLLRHAFPIFSVLGLIYAANVAYEAIMFKGVWHSAHKTEGTMFRFSKKQNVIFLVLDTFASPAFNRILEEDAQYKEIFSDFVYFRNTVASFPTTAMSIPAILSGTVYDNSLPMTDFSRNVMANSLPNLLYDHGYGADLVTLGHYCYWLKTKSCTSLQIANSEDYRRAETQEALRLLDLSLFRASPQTLKRYIYNDHEWRLQRAFQARKGPAIHTQSLDFMDTLERSAELSLDGPVFKFFHLMIPHQPYRLDAECSYTTMYKHYTQRNFGIQSRCALKLAHRLLEVLRNLEAYDNSTIVILADHGAKLKFNDVSGKKGFPQIGSALPLLLIKPAGRRAAFEISHAPAALADLPKTIADLLQIRSDFPGMSVLEMGEVKRERVFRNYVWRHKYWGSAFLPPMQEFVIDGDAWNVENWEKGRILSAAS